MSNIFSGILINNASAAMNKELCQRGMKFKQFNNPFIGVSIDINKDLAFYRKEIIDLSLIFRDDIFIGMQYDTWAGRIDHCVGCVGKCGKIYKEIAECNDGQADSIFRELIEMIGIKLDNGLYFAPFDSGKCA